MNRKKIAGICGALATVALVGGAFAYFSGTAETATNKFSIVAGEQDEDGAIEIKEPEWKEENAKDLEPGEKVTKDPYVHSNVDYDGWIIMKVTVPTIEAEIDGVAGTYEVFDINDWNTSDFTLLTAKTPEQGVYYYGYNAIVENGGDTTKLFTEIQEKDFSKITKAAIEALGQNPAVDVDAAIIQTIDPSTGVEFTSVSDAFAALGNEFAAGNANIAK